jgi:ABC-2 type transport system permease protein
MSADNADTRAAVPARSLAAGAAAPAAGGVIHDLGYRRFGGRRLGRARIISALCWHSLRSAFGIGRGAKAKIVPVVAFVIMCLPALANAVAVARGSARIFPYDTYQVQVRVLIMIIFVAAQAPELVSRDLRSHVLPLYFSRQLRRLDYPLAKYAAFTAACLVVIDVPLLLLYLGTITQAHGGAAIWSETRALIPGLLVGVMWAAVLAAIGLVLASLSGRRAYATGAIAIFYFLTFVLARIVYRVTIHTGGQAFCAAGSPPGVACGPPARAALAGLISPFSVLDGVRQWLGGAPREGTIALMGHYGPVYGIVLAVLLAASLGGLAARYRRVGVA